MGLLGALFGGSKSKSTSSNQAYPFLKDAFAPAISAGAGGINALNEELSGGFDAFKDKAGFDFLLGEGLSGITGAGAAKGLLRSGATGKAFQRFGNDLKSTMYGNYLDRLGGLGQLGLGAGGVVAGAGGESTSSGKQQNGILTSLFSDPEVKENVVRVGTLDNGLGVYAFNYKDVEGPTQLGLMADEVEEKFPAAVGRGEWVDGSTRKTVDYGAVFATES